MVQSSRPLRRFSALFVLILGLFVVGPLVEASTCGLEGLDTCELVIQADEHGSDDASHGSDVLHNCNHGHCHTATHLPPGGGELLALNTPESVEPSRDFLLVSTAPDSLNRPPRA
ncbi:MAG: hypothetical protein J0L52_04075 [Caulobacterales bacterium]|nr:hypothetical protein [Caulobacterales bacterium]